MSVIDAHAHVFPDPLLSALRRGESPLDMRVEMGAAGFDVVVHAEGYRYELPPAFFDPQARLAELDRLGVDQVVLSIAPTLYGYELDKASGISHARLCNDWLADFASSSDRFVGIASLPMADPAAAVDELDRAVGLGLRGAQVGPHVRGVALDDERFAGVLARASRLGVPLVLHPAFVGPLPGLERHFLTNVVGNPHQTTVAAASLIAGGVLDRLPDLSLLLVHGGGNLPYQVGRLDQGHRARPESMACAEPPSSYLERFSYDTLVYADPALRYLVDRVGARRVLFGTDSPFDMCGGGFQDQCGRLVVSPSDQGLIASVNAERLFGL